MNTQIINISLPSDLLKLADQIAKKEIRSRSELFREAIRSYVLRKKKWEELFSYSERKAKTRKIRGKDIEKLISDYRAGR